VIGGAGTEAVVRTWRDQAPRLRPRRACSKVQARDRAPSRTSYIVRARLGCGHSGRTQLDNALALLGPGADPHVRMHVLLDQGEADDPRATLRRCDEVLEMALALEFAGVAMKARLLRAHALSRIGQTEAAATAMRELVPLLSTVQPADLYLGHAWWLAAQVFEASGDGDEALMALAHGAQWVRRVALPNVPEEFRDSFMQRNPVNRALLAAADRRLAR